MAVFGTGLYSGDFAMDLRSTIGAVVRLPFDNDKLAGILCESEPKVANASDDENHGTFLLSHTSSLSARLSVIASATKR